MTNTNVVKDIVLERLRDVQEIVATYGCEQDYLALNHAIQAYKAAEQKAVPGDEEFLLAMKCNFAVKHYSEDEGAIIKYDGGYVEINGDRQDATDFLDAIMKAALQTIRQHKTQPGIDGIREVREAFADLRDNLGAASLSRNALGKKVRGNADNALATLDKMLKEGK